MNSSLDIANIIHKQYEDLLNSYVADYFIEEHWKKLPRCWQDNLEDISLNQLSDVLDFSVPLNGRVYPLSLLCLRLLIKDKSVSRTRTNRESSANENQVFMKYFWKNVKLKKRHEINIMAQICSRVAEESNCRYIVDIGSGLGHLSRMLSFGYGLQVLTFEADAGLSKLAQEMDANFEENLNRKNILHRKIMSNIHVCKRIKSELSAEEFLKLVRQSFANYDDNFSFGLVGLHPCGGLGSTLLRLFNNCANIAFLSMASCCYMKMNLNSSSSKSDFPLSTYCRRKKIQLSYLSCEIACHAIENFVEKLRNTQQNHEFKIHAYRAALEKILVSLNPYLKHSMVCGSKYNVNLSLKEYLMKTLNKYSFTVSDDVIEEYEDLIERSWEKVVIFYSLRLLLAPLIETIILMDRKLFVEETNSFCEIVPAFDCIISPRNQVLLAKKSA